MRFFRDWIYQKATIFRSLLVFMLIALIFKEIPIDPPYVIMRRKNTHQSEKMSSFRMLRKIPKLIPLQIRLLRVSPKISISQTPRKFDELKITWYQVLGVSEKATAAEIEEAFHEKLTSTDNLASKTNVEEVDAVLEQSVSSENEKKYYCNVLQL